MVTKHKGVVIEGRGGYREGVTANPSDSRLNTKILAFHMAIAKPCVSAFLLGALGLGGTSQAPTFAATGILSFG